MKQYLAGSILLMALFFQCSMNLPKKGKTFVNLEEDQLTDPQHINRFLERLNQLKASNGDSLLKIVHIGDSHIQMGYFSGEVRNALQHRFGGMGIGLFFPNSLCSGFNPLGLDLSSTSNWQCEKITNMATTIPLGLTGMAMKTTDPVSSINVAFKGKKEPVSSFVIFHETLNGNYQIRCEQGSVATRKVAEHTAITTIVMNEPVDEALVEFIQKGDKEIPLVIYAVSVNNPANHGVDYNTFGVSGGQYKFFSKNTPLLAEQLAAIKPDLMIVSMGSNDSYDKNLTMEGYKEMVVNFIRLLKESSPQTEFILTTPPDTEYNKSKPVSGTIVNRGIVEAAKETGCALWDFYTVMGGYGSVQKWKQKKLGNKDGLHLTSKGYYLQGQLFNLALAKALEKKYPGNGWLPEAEEILAKTLR